MSKKKRGKIYFITSKDSANLIGLCRYDNNKLDNEELCKFLGITKKNEGDYFIWGWRKNNGTPKELKEDFNYFHTLYCSVENIKHLVIIANNEFIINELNIWIRLYYKVLHKKNGKLSEADKEFLIPKEKVEAFEYSKKRFKPITVDEHGIHANYIFEKEANEQRLQLASLI